MPQAASLAAELNDDLAIDVELVAGDKGIFDVMVDGQMVFSKYDTGRFPEPGEVTKLIKAS